MKRSERDKLARNLRHARVAAAELYIIVHAVKVQLAPSRNRRAMEYLAAVGLETAVEELNRFLECAQDALTPPPGSVSVDAAKAGDAVPQIGGLTPDGKKGANP
jgi:hypothetical protein